MMSKKAKRDAPYSTILLDQALKKRSDERERLREKTLKTTFSALNQLSKKVSFDKAYIFGSVTKKGRFDNMSDIDIGFFGLNDKDVISTTAFLSRELELDVDVIQLEGHRLAGYIKEGIEWKRNA